MNAGDPEEEFSGEFPLCEFWLGLLYPRVPVSACVNGHLTPAASQAPRSACQTCSAPSRVLSAAERDEMASIAALGDMESARAYCKHLAGK